MNWRKWLDEWGLAARGLVLATREKRFWAGFVPAFIFFGWLINMLSNGIGKFAALFQVSFPEAMKIIGENLLAVFGFNQAFLNWLPTFAISILQGILIGMIVLLWHKKREQKNENSAGVEKAGIIAGLIALGAGCPTCGTTLITPLLGAVFSAGGLAVTGTVSTIVTWVAIIIAVLALKKLGLENYVIIKNEEYMKRHKKTKRVKEARE